MAASAWQFYNTFREKLGQGGIDLSGTNFLMALCKSDSNFATDTLSAYSQLLNEVSNQNGYATGGESISAEAWAVGASAGQYKFDSTAVVWTASGGSITSVKGAVIYQSGGALVCWSTLTTTGVITVTDTNTLTVTPNASGIFTLT